MKILAIVLESIRTVALVVLVAAIAWTAFHGITLHHVGNVNVDHSGIVSLDSFGSGFDVNISR